MKRLAILAMITALAAALCLPREAVAAEHVVSQKKMQFQVSGERIETLTIKVGDTIAFANDDTMAHNVFSRTPGFTFDLKALRPGTTGRHTFAKAGTIEVECALHPRMKLKLVVEP